MAILARLHGSERPFRSIKVLSGAKWRLAMSTETYHLISLLGLVFSLLTSIYVTLAGKKSNGASFSGSSAFFRSALLVSPTSAEIKAIKNTLSTIYQTNFDCDKQQAVVVPDSRAHIIHHAKTVCKHESAHVRVSNAACCRFLLELIAMGYCKHGISR